MDNFRPFEYNQFVWNRRLLHGFWFIALLSVIVECIYMGNAVNVMDFVCMYIVRPTVLLIIVILLAEAAIRFIPKQHDYILISSSALIANIITIINADQTYILFSLFVPVLVSFFYFQLNKLLFAVGISFLSFTIICFFDRGAFRYDFSMISGIISIMMLMCMLSVGMMVRGREVTEYMRSFYESKHDLQHRHQNSEKAVTKDPLTGAYNHASFHEFLDLLIKQSDSGFASLQLAFVNLDRFRELNEAFGYRAGDEVLKSLAGIMHAKIGYRHLLARFGGEEFAILFTGTTLQDAQEKLEEIRQAISEASHVGLNGGRITVSAGLCSYSAGLGKAKLISCVQKALREAKERGRNCTMVDSPASVLPA